MSEVKAFASTDAQGLPLLIATLPSGSDLTIAVWISDLDGVPVVQIDTTADPGRFRINLNDGPVWDGDPDTDDVPGAHFVVEK